MPSFPRKRESMVLTAGLDSRLRGNDEMVCERRDTYGAGVSSLLLPLIPSLRSFYLETFFTTETQRHREKKNLTADSRLQSGAWCLVIQMILFSVPLCLCGEGFLG